MSPGAAAQRPPRLLLTLLGDYWWQRTEPLPSAAIVALLAEFGVSDSAARAALSRLTRNGLLVTSKAGRRTYSRLSSRAAAILDDGARRIFSFGAANQPWDGRWSLVAFSIPEDNRAARDALRKQLRWLGFAPLYDGLWLSPRDHAAEVIGYLKDLDITTATAFRATSVPAECDIPARAWDLDGLRGRYEHFISFARQLRDTTAAGQVPPMDALIARTRVMDEWRAFPGLDPDLPAELLPSAWPRATGPRAVHRVLRPARPAGRPAGPADHHPVQPGAGRAGRLPQLGTEAERRARSRERALRACGRCRRTRERQGLRPTPPNASSSAGGPPGAGSGRQRGHETTPGSTSSRPSKKLAISAGVRCTYGSAPLSL